MPASHYWDGCTTDHVKKCLLPFDYPLSGDYSIKEGTTVISLLHNDIKVTVVDAELFNKLNNGTVTIQNGSVVARQDIDYKHDYCFSGSQTSPPTPVANHKAGDTVVISITDTFGALYSPCAVGSPGAIPGDGQPAICPTGQISGASLAYKNSSIQFECLRVTGKSADPAQIISDLNNDLAGIATVSKLN